jgi:hypothetical protein
LATNALSCGVAYCACAAVLTANKAIINISLMESFIVNGCKRLKYGDLTNNF